MTTPDRHLTHWAEVPSVQIDLAHEINTLSGPDDGEPLQMPGMTYEATIAVPITSGINAAIDAILGIADRRIPETQAPTDTCTCHCWERHPDAPGRCSAASMPGLPTRDGQPVCHRCWAATRQTAAARTPWPSAPTSEYDHYTLRGPASTRVWVNGEEITHCISSIEPTPEDQ